MIERVSQRCLDSAVFPHVRLRDPNRNYDWHPLTGMLMRDYEEFSLPQAVASLLNTPRSLRHALGRTFSAWTTLHGEIDFDHLLAVNILRFGAPECFQFLMRRWDRLHSLPSQHPFGSQQRMDGLRQAILDDWNRMIENVEWKPAAALQVMEFILPAAGYWLAENFRGGHAEEGRQQVSEERYWIRAINEAIDANDVRDQEVIRDVQAWLVGPGTTTELVTKLTSLPQYSDVWENLAGNFFSTRREDILLLCEEVVRRILSEHGPMAGHDSQGFVHTWRFAHPRVSNLQENRGWLQERISEAAPISIEMVNGLWHYYGNPGRYSILRNEDAEPIRQHVLDTVRGFVTDGQSLAVRLTAKNSAMLYQLVFDPGNEGEKILADAQSWSWLGPHILEALRNGNVLAAANCAVLLGARGPGRERTTVATEVLDQFFGDNASEVIDRLESLIDQLEEDDQPYVRKIVRPARNYLAGRALPHEQRGTTDTD
jgi:hypothetical protein